MMTHTRSMQLGNKILEQGECSEREIEVLQGMAAGYPLVLSNRPKYKRIVPLVPFVK